MWAFVAGYELIWEQASRSSAIYLFFLALFLSLFLSLFSLSFSFSHIQPHNTNVHSFSFLLSKKISLFFTISLCHSVLLSFFLFSTYSSLIPFFYPSLIAFHCLFEIFFLFISPLYFATKKIILEKKAELQRQVTSKSRGQKEKRTLDVRSKKHIEINVASTNGKRT